MKPKTENVATAMCTWYEKQGDIPDNPAECYRNGKRHGRWALCYANDDIHIGDFLDGEKHGRWNLFLCNGTQLVGSFEHGKRCGEWVLFYPRGGFVRLDANDEIVRNSFRE